MDCTVKHPDSETRPAHSLGPGYDRGDSDALLRTLEDNTVMVTGGARAGIVSARTEVYSFTTQQWTRRADMNQRRSLHSCTTVWLDSANDPANGIFSYGVDTNNNNSVLSVVVAGGEPL